MTGVCNPSYQSGFYSQKRGGMPKYPSLRRGLVGSWCPSLGQTGTRLMDQSVYANHGTLTNMDSATDWIVSGGKLALDFDGSNDYVQCGSSTNWYNTNSIALCAWVKRSSAADGGYVVSKNNDGSASGPSIFFDTANQIVCHGILRTTTSGVYGDTEWMHVAVSITNLVVTFYKNGILTDTSTSGPYIGLTWPNSIPINIGRRESSTAAAVLFSGLIDDVNIFNRALSPQEIRVLASRRGIIHELRRGVVARGSSIDYSGNNMLMGCGL